MFERTNHLHSKIIEEAKGPHQHFKELFFVCFFFFFLSPKKEEKSFRVPLVAVLVSTKQKRAHLMLRCKKGEKQTKQKHKIAKHTENIQTNRGERPSPEQPMFEEKEKNSAKNKRNVIDTGRGLVVFPNF